MNTSHVSISPEATGLAKWKNTRGMSWQNGSLAFFLRSKRLFKGEFLWEEGVEGVKSVFFYEIWNIILVRQPIIVVIQS
jgi:hypothetical protein